MAGEQDNSLCDFNAFGYHVPRIRSSEPREPSHLFPFHRSETETSQEAKHGFAILLVATVDNEDRDNPRPWEGLT